MAMLAPSSANRENSQLIGDAANSEEDSLDLPRPNRSALSRLNTRRSLHMHRFNRYSALLKWVAFVLVVLLLFRFFPNYQNGGLRLIGQRRLVILLWNDPITQLYPYEWWPHRECGCIVTNQRNGTGVYADAIVFNGDKPYNLSGFETIMRNENFLAVYAAKMPLNQVPNPLNNSEAVLPYNLTMSYRYDSDIVWTDDYFIDIDDGKRQQQFVEPISNFTDLMQDEQLALLRSKLDRKDRIVTYMMYPMNEHTRPESLYLEELRKYMQLDALVDCLQPNDCSYYKFMLIFNINACPDYVHPDIYAAFRNYVVPVIIGGGNLTDLLPKGSYVDGHELSSPSELADYLMKVADIPEEYEQYFWWHLKYQVFHRSESYCELCSLLRQPQQLAERKVNVFGKWWTHYRCRNDSDALTNA